MSHISSNSDLSTAKAEAKNRLVQWLEQQGPPDYRTTVEQNGAFVRITRELDKKRLSEVSDEVIGEWMKECLEWLKSEKREKEEWISLQDGNIEGQSVTDRCVGTLLGVFIGDVLGAPVEGRDHEWIKEDFTCAEGIKYIIPGKHMGVDYLGYRYGMYTDDTLMTLALAQVLAREKGVVDAIKCATHYAQFWKTNPIEHGLPDTAKDVLEVTSLFSYKKKKKE
ncbi:hypothetical protein RFI_16276 [Reticulomyxa filosa]|uniref:ADP-ribosylglycohydrolase n=1 Tax=Reticulomyxa filosa TaxID=46433 RepID=X6N4V5_RETFI|nr:hypothetical protein RFI_16276 [Reticulomyxa filosa]|eukprot:ETO20928.1 hypothetical protein RFI_16276 [Reticulomyxa filosa]